MLDEHVQHGQRRGHEHALRHAHRRPQRGGLATFSTLPVPDNSSRSFSCLVNIWLLRVFYSRCMNHMSIKSQLMLLYQVLLTFLPFPHEQFKHVGFWFGINSWTCSVLCCSSLCRFLNCLFRLWLLGAFVVILKCVCFHPALAVWAFHSVALLYILMLLPLFVFSPPYLPQKCLCQSLSNPYFSI